MELLQLDQGAVEARAANLLKVMGRQHVPLSLENLKRLSKEAGFDATFLVIDSEATDLNSFFELSEGGKIRIFVNRHLTPDWLRYVITKELAHAFLSNVGDSTQDAFLGGVARSVHLDRLFDEDIYAEKLARALLMDGEVMREIWPQFDNTGESTKNIVDGLAALFQVPAVVASARLQDLGLIPRVADAN